MAFIREAGIASLRDGVQNSWLTPVQADLARLQQTVSQLDGATFAGIEAAGVEKWLAGLRAELRDKTYRPQPVRRVSIPKPWANCRGLARPMRS